MGMDVHLFVLKKKLIVEGVEGIIVIMRMKKTMMRI